MPANSTSVLLAARTALGAPAAIAHCSESEMFDLPEPFGPMITATPGKKRSSTCSGNDLKPRSLRAERCTGYSPASIRESASRAAACSDIFFDGPLPVPSATPSSRATVVNLRRCGGPEDSISS